MITRERARELRAVIESAVSAYGLDDAAAVAVVELFPQWEVGKTYAIGTRVQHDGKLYECVNAHTAAAEWLKSTRKRDMTSGNSRPALTTHTTPATVLSIMAPCTRALSTAMYGPRTHTRQGGKSSNEGGDIHGLKGRERNRSPPRADMGTARGAGPLSRMRRGRGRGRARGRGDIPRPGVSYPTRKRDRNARLHRRITGGKSVWSTQI